MNLIRSLSALTRPSVQPRAPLRPGSGNPIWAIAGGKGGTGKSVIASNLAIGLAVIGYDVILVDGDLGGPNLHNYLNIKRPQFTLNDFASGQAKKLRDIIIDTPLSGLKFISGGTALLGMANLQHAKKEKLLRQILDLAADFIIVDLGAGTSFNTLDFFNLSSQGILIVNPEPNSKYDAFYFLKNAIFRRLSRHFPKSNPFQKLSDTFFQSISPGKMDLARFLGFLEEKNIDVYLEVMEILKFYTPRLIMNKVRTNDQVREGFWFANLVKNYLRVEMDYVGAVEYDKRVIYASEKIIPFMFRYPKVTATKEIFELIERLNPHQRTMTINSFRKFRKEIQKASTAWLD